jgi:hypothetical protein
MSATPPDGVKPDQNIAEFHNMLGSHPARVIVFVKASQPFMANRLDHLAPRWQSSGL